jgi:hypothetical protein
MPELKIFAPTYYGNIAAEKMALRAKREFDDPYVPIVVRRADGLRIVLGSHDYFDGNAPDIQIERRPCGWAVFLHPVGGGDPSGLIFFLDDGRSFLIPECGPGVTTPPIVTLEPNATVSEIDEIKLM